MRELRVKIKYTKTCAPFSAFEVKKAMEHLFGINTDFEVQEIDQEQQPAEPRDTSQGRGL